MNKKLIALAVAGALAAPLAANAAPTVYGKAHVSIDAVSVDDSATGAAITDNWQVVSRASRVGVKGSEDLGGGLKAVYHLEWQIDMADNTGGSGGATDNITSRNQIVGLSGNFGTLVAGRHDTPMKMSTGKLDFFGDQAGDYNATVGIADVRANNAIAYLSPNMGGFGIQAAVVPGEQNVTVAGNEADSIADAVSVAGTFSQGPIYAAVAFESFDQALLTTTQDYDQTRFGIGYMPGAWKVAFVWENQDQGSAANGDRDLMQVSGAYTVGKNVIKAMYGTTDEWSNVANSGHDSLAVGWDYNLSKASQVYVQYADVDGETAGTDDKSTFSLGMVHSF